MKTAIYDLFVQEGNVADMDMEFRFSVEAGWVNWTHTFQSVELNTEIGECAQVTIEDDASGEVRSERLRKAALDLGFDHIGELVQGAFMHPTMFQHVLWMSIYCILEVDPSHPNHMPDAERERLATEAEKQFVAAQEAFDSCLVEQSDEDIDDRLDEIGIGYMGRGQPLRARPTMPSRPRSHSSLISVVGQPA